MIVALSAGRGAPLELRERIALDERATQEVLAAARARSMEVVVLSTCHRTELYGAFGGSTRTAAHELASLLGERITPIDQATLRVLEGRGAAEHLFRVTCGLDSLVVGERQIFTQIRRSYRLASDAGTVGPAIAGLFDRAIALGRRIRVATSFGPHQRSLGMLAARHLTAALDDLDGRAGVILGSGVAASDAATALAGAGARLHVLSRRLEAAAALAGRLGGHAAPLGQLTEALHGADFAVAAVGGGALVSDEHLPARPMHLVDLSVPRAIRVASPLVQLATIDDLRPDPLDPADIAVVESLIAAALASWDRRAPGSARARDLARLRAGGEQIARDEAASLITRLALTPEDADRVVTMSMRIAKKLLHAPTIALRDGDAATAGAVRRIYGLDG